MAPLIVNYLPIWLRSRVILSMVHDAMNGCDTHLFIVFEQPEGIESHAAARACETRLRTAEHSLPEHSGGNSPYGIATQKN